MPEDNDVTYTKFPWREMWAYYLVIHIIFQEQRPKQTLNIKNIYLISTFGGKH